MTISGQGKYHIAVRQEIPKVYCVVKMAIIKPFQEAFVSHSLDLFRLVLVFNYFPHFIFNTSENGPLSQS